MRRRRPPAPGRLLRVRLTLRCAVGVARPRETDGDGSRARKLDGGSGATDNGAMTTHAPRLPFSLEPLIAEARRRARQRRVLVAVAALLVVAGGAGASVIASGSSAVATGPRPVQAAIVGSVFGGWQQPTVPIGVFAPRFGIPVMVGNGSSEPVILERVRAVLGAPTGPHVPVVQIGARFRPWKPKTCPIRSGSPIPGYCGIDFNVPFATRPIAAERPSPVRIAPGYRALVQLNFRFLACSRRQAKETLSLQRLTAVYRLPDGAEITQEAPFMAGFGDPVAVERSGSLSKDLVPPAGATATTRPCHR
jgi:hypothetical protein